jgi:hypothetical protein
MRLLLPALALLSACGALGAATVEIRVTSGDLITGEVVQETASVLELKRQVMIKHKPVETSISVQKVNITMRKEVPSIGEQYQARKAGAQPSLLGQCALARWCVDHALVDEALEHTKAADQEDPMSAIVAKLYHDLGYTQVDGAWVDESEHLAKTGLVKVGDAVMTKEEAAAAKEQTIKAGANAHIEQQIRDAEWAIKTGEKKLAEATERRDKAKSELAKASADTKGATNRKEQLQKQIDARASRPQNNRSQQQDTADRAALQAAGGDASTAASAEKKWEKELENANEALTRVKASVDKAKAALPDLKKQLEVATGKPAETPAKPGDKPAEKTADKPADKPAAEGKPKSRFAD